MLARQSLGPDKANDYLQAFVDNKQSELDTFISTWSGFGMGKTDFYARNLSNLTAPILVHRYSNSAERQWLDDHFPLNPPKSCPCRSQSDKLTPDQKSAYPTLVKRGWTCEHIPTSLIVWSLKTNDDVLLIEALPHDRNKAHGQASAALLPNPSVIRDVEFGAAEVRRYWQQYVKRKPSAEDILKKDIEICLLRDRDYRLKAYVDVCGVEELAKIKLFAYVCPNTSFTDSTQVWRVT